MRRLLLVPVLLAFTACTSAPTAVALKGQDAAQQKADAQVCDDQVAANVGGVIGKSRSVGLAAMLGGVPAIMAAKEAQQKYVDCMAARGYQVKSE